MNKYDKEEFTRSSIALEEIIKRALREILEDVGKCSLTPEDIEEYVKDYWKYANDDVSDVLDCLEIMCENMVDEWEAVHNDNHHLLMELGGKGQEIECLEEEIDVLKQVCSVLDK